MGPFTVSPESWRAQYAGTWNSPSVNEDPDCVRVAQQGVEIVGYAATDYRNAPMAVVQELCTCEGAAALPLAQALLEDAEAIGRARDRHLLLLHPSAEEGVARSAAEGLGYEFGTGTGVFMVEIIDLAQFLAEIQPELTRRLHLSEFHHWTGRIALRSGDLAAGLYLHDGCVEVERAVPPTITAEIAPELLPLLLLGRIAVGEAHLQDALTITAEDRLQALRLLDALFPRAPMFLPRAQWW